MRLRWSGGKDSLDDNGSDNWEEDSEEDTERFKHEGYGRRPYRFRGELDETDDEDEASHWPPPPPTSTPPTLPPRCRYECRRRLDRFRGDRDDRENDEEDDDDEREMRRGSDDEDVGYGPWGRPEGSTRGSPRNRPFRGERDEEEERPREYGYAEEWN